MKFESASNSWDIGPSCSITRISVDLEYQDVNQTLIVSLNPNLTSILGTKYLPNGLVAGPVNNPNWVGYEYHPGPALAQSSMEFYLPSASAGTVGCSTGCAFFVWNGLTAQSGGGSGSGKGIAQGGSASFVACNIHGCTSTYSFFYEFFPAGPNYCSASVNAGDLMDTVVSTANSAGNPTNNYNIAVYDDTNGHACTPSTKNGWSIGDAYYSQFMGELPPGTPQQALPRFSTVDVGPGSYCTTTTSCQLIGTNYINYYIMFNGGSDDATPTAVSNYAFTIVYHTSTGT